MKPPKDVTGVQTLLGCVNYLLQFVPNLAEITKPMRKLTQVDKHNFAWLPDQQRAFEKIKERLTAASTLAYFDQTKDIVMQTDACEYGVGGVLLQNG